MEEISCAQRYTAEGPYPEVRVGGRNRRWGAAMLSNVGGSVSEMSAVADYIYGQFKVSGRPEVADSFHHIAVVEMHHLTIFAELARQLGEDPRLWSGVQGRKRYWTPEYLNYPQRLGPLIQYAIAEERATIRKYEGQARWIGDENIVANLRRVIEDERVHIQVLQCLYESYCVPEGQDLDLGLNRRATR